MTANPEIPARADTLLGAARQAGHELVDSGSFGLEPVRAVHDSDYLDFRPGPARLSFLSFISNTFNQALMDGVN